MFQKGKSGNPGGRTKDQRERQRKLVLAIEALGGPNGEKYLERLHAIAISGEHRDSIQAIKELHDRLHGKAPQGIDLVVTKDGEGEGEIDWKNLSNAELDDIIGADDPDADAETSASTAATPAPDAATESAPRGDAEQ